MILELVSGAATAICAGNLVALYLLYRQYRTLVEESLEFAGMVISSLEENEDGSITTDTLSLAAFAMDHASRLSVLTRTI